jgi:molybdopterin-guanine dinucleotide biosynthesis protein A
VVAGVLVGGRSTRMGSCKALLRYGTKTFMEHVALAAGAVADEVVLLGHLDNAPPELQGLPRLRDDPQSAGPVAGLIPLLAYAGDRLSLLIACDMPLIKQAILRRLVEACDESVDGAAYRVREAKAEYYPCALAVHPRTLSIIRATDSIFSLRNIIETIECHILEADWAAANSLRSFNTPDEYADLLASKENSIEVGT